MTNRPRSDHVSTYPSTLAKPAEIRKALAFTG